MSTKTQKTITTILCGLMLAYVGSMLYGVTQLAMHQGVSWDLNLLTPRSEVRVVAAVIELSLFIGAALIPIAVVWWPHLRSKKWCLYVWIPCIAYMLFIGFNSFYRGPHNFASTARSMGMLLVWLAISLLFVGSLRQKPIDVARVESEAQI